MSVSVDVRITGLDGTYAMLMALSPAVVSKRGGPVRKHMRKGATVLRKQELANLAAVTANATSAEKRLSTGFLAKNVVVTRGKAPASGNGERFLVRVRRKTYPDRKGKPVTTLAAANLLEYGSSTQPAEPWIRPAFTSRAAEAIDVITRGLGKEVVDIANKLGRQNRSLG